MRVDRMADLQERIGSIERRMSEVRTELDDMDSGAIGEEEAAEALEAFEPAWKSLNTNEQSRILRVIVDRVGYDGRNGKVAVTFRSTGLKEICGGAR
jgi:site-specific DNA recombinase